jgi:hypothetical protein
MSYVIAGKLGARTWTYAGKGEKEEKEEKEIS